MRVTLRPSLPADFLAINGQLPPYRARALTALAGDEILGVGGFIHMPDGNVWASVVMRPEARRFARAVHRAGRAAMALAREAGLTRVYAEADASVAPGAARWLEALGFRELERGVFVWEAACRAG